MFCSYLSPFLSLFLYFPLHFLTRCLLQTLLSLSLPSLSLPLPLLSLSLFFSISLIPCSLLFLLISSIYLCFTHLLSLPLFLFPLSLSLFLLPLSTSLFLSSCHSMYLSSTSHFLSALHSYLSLSYLSLLSLPLSISISLMACSFLFLPISSIHLRFTHLLSLILFYSSLPPSLSMSLSISPLTLCFTLFSLSRVLTLYPKIPTMSPLYPPPFPPFHVSLSLVLSRHIIFIYSMQHIQKHDFVGSMQLIREYLPFICYIQPLQDTAAAPASKHGVHQTQPANPIMKACRAVKVTGF